ncbi:MAG: hypothetical protein WDM81_13390 [Rhizomicrobium sp.]
MESVALAVFAVLIGYLAALTGGVLSPLVVWFALVPAEAALAGGRPAVLRAAVAAAAALAVVALIGALGALPVSRLPIPAWEIYAVSVFAAVVQAALVATAAQDRQRAADLAAAEGRRDVPLPRRQCDGPDHPPFLRRPHPLRQPRGAGDPRPAAAGPARPGAVLAGPSRRPQGDAGRFHGVGLLRPRRVGRSAHEAPRRLLCLGRDPLPPGAGDAGQCLGHRRRHPRHHRAQGARTRADRGPRPGRKRQPRQVQLPRQYEPRAAHPAQCHHRLLRGDDARDVRPRRRAPNISNIPA